MAIRRGKPATGRHASAAAAAAQDAAESLPRHAEPVDGRWTRLGDILVTRTKVTSSQVAEALLQQSASGKRLGQLLVELNALDGRELAQALAEQMDLAVVDLSQESPDADAIAKLPETIARSETAVPMMVVDGTLLVAVAEPSKTLHLQLSQAARMPITMVVAPASEIKRAINGSYRALHDVDTFITAFRESESTRIKQP